jgi:hypothetical protein
MSKKLIAVASAAALALSALVGVAPASADVGATFHLNGASGSADATAFTPSATASAANAGAGDLVVPANNYLIYTDTADRSTLVKVIVATAVGDLVTASSTGGLKILDLTGVGAIGSDYKAETTAGTDYKSDAGAQSLSRTATTDNVTFYVFTTSTTAASLTINKGGNTRVVWMKGKAGAAYNISAALPASVPISEPDDNNVIVKITDVFGNTVKANTSVDVSTTGAGVTLSNPQVANDSLALTYDSTEGGHGFKIYTTSSGSFAVELSISANDVSGLATAKDKLFLTSTAVSVTGLTAQVTALTAQVAALQAQLEASRPKATSVTKKRFNTLARKWNAANPGSRVALKK